MPNGRTSHLEKALKARERLQGAQQKLHICSGFPGDSVEAEGHHRDALEAAGIPLGPLHGVPMVVKDIIDLAGHPTRAGSATRADQAPATSDAPVVANLRAAGAIPVAKTNTVEFAFGGWGTNASQGTPRNPWKPDEPHTPGGSSSGTGVAVGGGFVPAGLGTDTGGSVRIPAAFCGCVGLKTSVGLVSRAGVVPLSDTFDSIGPLTDTVRRAGEMLAAMQGEDLADPTTIGTPKADPLGEIDRGVSGVRLGRLSPEALADSTPEVLGAFERAVETLAAAGATIETFDLPKSFAHYQSRATAIISSDAYAFHGHLADSNEAPLNDTTRMRMVMGRDLSAKDRVLAQRSKVSDIADFLARMDRLDAVLMPSTPVTALPLTEVDENDYRMSLYTRVANYLELAALSVPIDLTPSGLPTSLQIVVRRFHDPLALRIGQSFEEARGAMPAPPQV